jgi:hypothetical protein
MRFLTGIIACVVCGAIWYASTSVAAQPQALQAALTIGETVTLAFDANAPGNSCVVMDVRGEFVGCRADTSIPGRTPYEHWYNLRLVSRIDRVAK